MHKFKRPGEILNLPLGFMNT